MVPKRRTKASKMKPEEARELYLLHKGSTLSMCFASPQKYNEFVGLRLGAKVIESWDREILAAAEQAILGEVSVKKWSAFEDYFDALCRIEKNYAEYLEKFYGLINYAADALDPMQKILIMELFGGKNGDLNKGIIKRITQKSFDAERLLCCIRRLADFEPTLSSEHRDWKDPVGRYLLAEEKISQAVQLYFNGLTY